MQRLNDLFRIKTEVLCWGIKTTKTAEEIFLAQHPTLHKRTGHSGIHIVLKGKLVVNAMYGEKFCQSSPYKVGKINNQYWLFKKNEPICQFSVISAPKWYKKKTQDGTIMADILLQEGVDTLITAIWNNCCYYSNNTQCKFCILGYEKGVEWKKIESFVETVKAALKEKPSYFLHLTGGNTFTEDHGIKYYQSYIKAVRQFNKTVPISLEISPPNDMKYLEAAVKAGANGFSINIEVWDENKRKEICPGKSQISRDLYFQAWKRGIDLVGKFKISSVLLVGLDTPKNIQEGIKQMVKMGVKPVLIPFKPFNNCALSYLPQADPLELLKLSNIAGEELKKAGANEKQFVGCEHCGACTLEKDFLKID